jgi:CHAD domain-containing protein
MTTPALALQAAGEGPLDTEALVTALSGRFTVQAGARRLVRGTRVDTFDHRLAGAGLTLEHQVTGSTESLVLSRPDASTATAEGTAPRWPAFAAALPPGAVRAETAPVAGIRALTAQSQQKRWVRRLELRNDDEKLVVRLEVDEPGAATSTSPATVVVRTMRGYEDEARRVTRILTAAGLQAAADDDGRPAQAAAAAPQIDRDAPATELLAHVFGEFHTAMQVNLPGLLDDVDTEFLHDFRVAVRRTRATLKLGRPALPDELLTRWEPAFKWLGDLTTPVRDLDVYELELPTMGGWLVGADPADLEPFAQHVRRRRTAERRALVRGLRSARYQRLVTDWQQTLAALAAAEPGDEPGRLTAGDLAARGISRAYRKVERGGRAITDESPAADLHALRKRCKELRYALEVFAPVVATAPRKKAVSELKVLQDVLGRFQDSEVQRASLRGFADEMSDDGTPAAALLAMGELIGHLDGVQARAREEVDATFGSFVRPASAQRLRQLGGGR